jgi:hypothetical protein
VYKQIEKNQVARLITPGTILWRAVNHSPAKRGQPSKVELDAVEFEPTDRGGWMCRTVFGANQFIWEPVCWYKYQSPRTYGIVTFLKEPPEDDNDWTHLIVTGSSRSGNALFATVGGRIPMREYLDFRSGWYAIHTQLCNEPVEVQLDAARRIQITLPPGQQRAFVSQEWLNDHHAACVECPLQPAD